ncbi:MAG TPA: hypothetical protein VLR49_08630 [Ferruginibacter sp.]|nr:hypothetical protein [Ferruginibacter sp.]
MNKDKILRSSLFISIAIAILATWYKLMHKPGFDSLFLVSIIAGIVFITTAIMEVSRSEKIDRSEKTMWIIGFLFLTTIAGLIYVLSARKRVV